MKCIKKRNQYKSLIFACLILPFLANAKEAKTTQQDPAPINQESLSFISFQSGFGSYVAAAQERVLPKKFGSELSVSGALALKGALYLNTASGDASYRFYALKRLSLEARYSLFANDLNVEGSDILSRGVTLPLEVKYPVRQAFYAGLNWYPVYGKFSLFNTIFHFDAYVSGLVGSVDIANTKKDDVLDLNDILAADEAPEEKKSLLQDMNLFPSAYLGGGLVVWYNKYLNFRAEVGARYYQFQVTNIDTEFRNIKAITSVGLGVVF